MESYLIIGLLAVAIVLLIVLIARQSKKSDNISVNESINTLSQRIDSEFERNRRETAFNQNGMREETTRALSEMNSKIENLRLENSESQNKTRVAIIKSLEDIREKSAEQNEKQAKLMGDAVDKMRESNEKKLDEMRRTVDEKLNETLTTRLDSSFKTVSDRLESVYKSLGEMNNLSQGVKDNVSALNRVLTNVKARGTWAEVQLAGILDQTIPGNYETNFASDPKSADRVEFAVKIPSNDGKVTYLPIDSKFPMEDYIRLCEAADEGNGEMLSAARKALETRVINEAKKVNKYINVPITTPYAILYLATEGLYAEISASRNGIAEKIQSEYNVMLAGPSTVTALLTSLSFGFKAVAINEKANEVRALLGAAKQQYGKFGILLSKARQKIDDAGKTLDEAGHRNSLILKKLGSVEELEGEEAANILGVDEN